MCQIYSTRGRLWGGAFGSFPCFQFLMGRGADVVATNAKERGSTHG